MLKKEKKRAADAMTQLEKLGQLPERSLSQNDAAIGQRNHVNGRHNHRVVDSVNRKTLSADGGDTHRRRPSSGTQSNNRDSGLDLKEEKTKKQIRKILPGNKLKMSNLNVRLN